MAIEGGDHEVDQLFSAVERDDVGEVSRLLEDGPHLMEVKRGGWLRRQTPLQIAAAWRRVGVLRLLVEKGADVNICDTDGDTQLHFAAKMGHADVVSILLRGGVDIGKKGKDGSTALAIASEAGHTGVVWQLLQHMAGDGLDEVTAQVNTCYTDGRTALHCAAGKGHEEVVSALLSCGADSSKRSSSNGNTALMLASYGGHIGVVRQLLQHTGGRGLNETNGWGATALWWACSYGRVEVVRALLWAGADRTIARDGVTPRQVAQNNRHAECVALLDVSTVLIWGSVISYLLG
jgi:ankyrin repeat protein